MNTRKKYNNALVFLLTLALGALLTECSSTKSATGGSKKGTTLRYSFPENQDLKYKTGSDIKQTLDIYGQEMIIDIGQHLVYTSRLKNKSKNENQIHITIDTMDLFVNSPQGDINPNMDGVNNKSFNMTLSSLGSGMDVSEAESIQFEITPGVKRNVATAFKFLFPRLPEKALNVGDTWSLTDTIAEKYDNEEVTMIIDGDYTLAGFETLSGLECAMITSVISGTRSGKANQQGMDMVSDGTMQGSGTFYFAYKDGYLVKDISKIIVDGTLDIQGAQQGSFPMKFEINNLTELIK